MLLPLGLTLALSVADSGATAVAARVVTAGGPDSRDRSSSHSSRVRPAANATGLRRRRQGGTPSRRQPHRAREPDSKPVAVRHGTASPVRCRSPDPPSGRPQIGPGAGRERHRRTEDIRSSPWRGRGTSPQPSDLATTLYQAAPVVAPPRIRRSQIAGTSRFLQSRHRLEPKTLHSPTSSLFVTYRIELHNSTHRSPLSQVRVFSWRLPEARRGQQGAELLQPRVRVSLDAYLFAGSRKCGTWLVPPPGAVP